MLFLSTLGRRMLEKSYSAFHSQSWRYMEVSGQLHAPASLIPRKQPGSHFRMLGEFQSRSGCFAEEKVSYPCQDSNLESSGPLLLAIPSTLCWAPSSVVTENRMSSKLTITFSDRICKA
jgi:hypothetical protein